TRRLIVPFIDMTDDDIWLRDQRLAHLPFIRGVGRDRFEGLTGHRNRGRVDGLVVFGRVLFYALFERFFRYVFVEVELLAQDARELLGKLFLYFFFGIIVITLLEQRLERELGSDACGVVGVEVLKGDQLVSRLG